MANTKKIQATELETEVLYQKLGDRWFAFSIVNDDVFMSPVSDDQVAEAKRDPSSAIRTSTHEFDTNDGSDNSESI